jgi:hypothetical protein
MDGGDICWIAKKRKVRVTIENNNRNRGHPNKMLFVKQDSRVDTKMFVLWER